MKKNIVTNFINAINSKDIEALVSLMSEDHTFIDAYGSSVEGKEKMRNGWIGYFEWFPDYLIEAEQIIEDGSTIVVFGFASGTYKGMVDRPDAHWRIPVSLRAVVENKTIKKWQVYADTKIPFDIIVKYK